MTLLTKGDARQAHHIIPWGKSGNEVVQRAAKSSNAFHMNDALNGIPLGNSVHMGSHANYDKKVADKLNDFIEINPNATPSQCYNFISNLTNSIRTAVQNNPGIHINQLNF